MTIYIPIAVEKELPEIDVSGNFESYRTYVNEDHQTWKRGYRDDNDGLFYDENGYDHEIEDFTHWLKPVLISDLITAVQNSIAPQRQDHWTAIEISINEFLK